MSQIIEKTFIEILQPKLGGEWERAMAVFRNYGPNLSFDVTNVLCHAADKGQVGKVLDILEQHHKDHLQFQHPEIKGMVSNLLGVNPTQRMFLAICEQTLGLKKNSA